MEQQKVNPGLGKAMLVLAWVSAIVVLTLIFGNWQDRQYNPNQTITESGGEIILRQNRANHYVATGTINGSTVIFLLDTGATDVSVPASLASKLGLTAGSQKFASTANGTIKIYDTRIDSLTLGTITLTDVRASINPHMKGNEVLLGMSALKDLEFTQSGETLTLRRQ